MSFENLLVETRDGVAIVTINRPDKLNALNDRTMEELDAAFAALGADAERAGRDPDRRRREGVRGRRGHRRAGARRARWTARSARSAGQRVLDRIENLGKPVIAAVNGFALGGGCELAHGLPRAHRLRERAGSGTPEVKLGIMCGYAGTQRLPRLVGKGRALEILLTRRDGRRAGGAAHRPREPGGAEGRAAGRGGGAAAARCSPTGRSRCASPSRP